MGLRVLITNLNLWPPTGTVLYVRDLALELQRQGHSPSVLSSTEGDIADELRGAGIEVSSSLRRGRPSPDIIHGHHYAPTMVALDRWPTVPAIHVCHDHASPDDRTPIHPNISRYFGVSRVCVRRLIAEGVPEVDTGLFLNFVDLTRFVPRAPLPERPRRALVFSNYATEDTHLPAVREACRAAALELDVVGAGVGRIVGTPERLLGDYDIVFAKAKAAMEAMAVGSAVILCDFNGIGPMVTTAEFDRLRPLNFGFEALRDPLRPEFLLREIARYDAADALRVRDCLRSGAGLAAAVDNLERIYRRTIDEHPRRRPGTSIQRLALRQRLFLRLYWSWRNRPTASRDRIAALPGGRHVVRVTKRLLGAGGRSSEGIRES